MVFEKVKENKNPPGSEIRQQEIKILSSTIRFDTVFLKKTSQQTVT